LLHLRLWYAPLLPQIGFSWYLSIILLHIR
jgi:hypothetical protein